MIVKQLGIFGRNPPRLVVALAFHDQNRNSGTFQYKPRVLYRSKTVNRHQLRVESSAGLSLGSPGGIAHRRFIGFVGTIG